MRVCVCVCVQENHRLEEELSVVKLKLTEAQSSVNTLQRDFDQLLHDKVTHSETLHTDLIGLHHTSDQSVTLWTTDQMSLKCGVCGAEFSSCYRSSEFSASFSFSFWFCNKFPVSVFPLKTSCWAANSRVWQSVRDELVNKVEHLSAAEQICPSGGDQTQREWWTDVHQVTQTDMKHHVDVWLLDISSFKRS